MGETPNLAARLQGIAEPNSVVIAESTRKLIGNLFDLEDLGAQDLKGIAGPVRAWAALRQASVEGRFEAFHGSGADRPHRTRRRRTRPAARIAAATRYEFADISEVQPELLARHCTEAGEIEKAADLWSKAGQRSLERSALIEAAEKLARALSLMATLPGTPELRREQIKLQVALITPLMQGQRL